MIVLVEGPSAAGKTTWVAAHAASVAVPEYEVSARQPSRRADPEAAARFWAAANSQRWLDAIALEASCGVAVCDTDPFKLHYVWCLWQIGEVAEDEWLLEMEANRSLFAIGELGLADAVLCSIPSSAVLAERRTADPTRRRSRFDVHSRLAEPLRRWYQGVDSLEPGRVVWEHPVVGLAAVENLTLRSERSGLRLFDGLLDAIGSAAR